MTGGTIVNLDPNFTPFGVGIDIKLIDFPSGCEPHIKIPPSDSGYHKTILTTRITSGNDIIRLLLATDALRRRGAKEIELFIPYLPFARQDRIMDSGEPLSAKVFANLINSQGFAKVMVYDPHSDVGPALLDNCVKISNHDFVRSVVNDIHDTFFIISPDAGAYKKIFELCRTIEYRGEIVMCNKIRDTTNGVIRSMTVSHEDLGGKDCLIVDDICDGGGTFIMLAEELQKRNCGAIHLVVSHGIFSKGLKEITKRISKIHTTNSFMDINSMTEFGLHNERHIHRVTQYKINLNAK